MHTDSSKKLRAMARSALKELGDRSLSIIDAKDEEIYMQFRVCSQTLTEVTFSAPNRAAMLTFFASYTEIRIFPENAAIRYVRILARFLHQDRCR